MIIFTYLAELSGLQISRTINETNHKSQFILSISTCECPNFLLFFIACLSVIGSQLLVLLLLRLPMGRTILCIKPEHLLNIGANFFE